MRYAVMVADCGSINEASRKLFISQPSLSNNIREIEREIGSVIFVRTNRGISITQDGEEFLGYARQMIEQYRMIEERFIDRTSRRNRFSVSTQHYSFAVEAFIETVKTFGMDKYEFAIHETKTHDVMNHVRTMKSEIGILYLNDFNREALTKLFREYEIEFHPLFVCSTCVYLADSHPLAHKKEISIEELSPYPCLSFEQGDYNSFYFAEEMLSTYEYKKIIKADDRATLLNLMVGLNAYTLCSGIISEDLNGSGYVAVPLSGDDRMTIGYLQKSRVDLSELAQHYLEELKKTAERSPSGVTMLEE